MAIRVVCRNGHALKVDDRSAGKSGLCPVCKVPVQIPPPDPRDMSEDALMDLLGPKEGEPPRARQGMVQPRAGQARQFGPAIAAHEELH